MGTSTDLDGKFKLSKLKIISSKPMTKATINIHTEKIVGNKYLFTSPNLCQTPCLLQPLQYGHIFP